MYRNNTRQRRPLNGCATYSLNQIVSSSKFWALLLLASTCAEPLLAQIKITFPVSRLVVQRNNSNQATVQIAGSYGQPLDAVEARVVARASGQGTSTDWTTIQTSPANGQFNGTMTVTGGWYTIQVRGIQNGTVVATDELDRFGVGEVFAIMGHSNAQGSGCTVNGQERCQSIAGASDDRVTVVAIDQSTSTFDQYLSTGDTKYLPGLAFSQLLLNSGMSPFAKIPWLWGRMGDVLVARINVPVLLYNAGFGGTNMQQTYWAAYDIPFKHSFVRYDLRMPYRNVRNLMNLYVPTTGIRAVLIQHGENDRDNPADQTYTYYRGVIDKMRTEFNKPNLAHIIALSSYVGGQFQNVRTAQNNVLSSTAQTYRGPDLDTDTDRPDGIHFSPTGQVKAGDLWANAITNAYLSAITPYMAEAQPLASISCATNNQLTLTQPASDQYIWNNNVTSNSQIVGAGTYSARIIDAQNKVLFPPAIVVPATVQPSAPTITTAGSSTVICQSAGLTLTSSYPGLNNWSTGSSATSISATTPGVYTLQAKSVYGCLSDPVSKTVALASATLSLQLQPARRVVALNDTVSFQLTVKNTSGCDVGRVTLQNRVPPNMTIESAGDGLSVDYADLSRETKMVSGVIPQVPAGQSVSKKYLVRVGAEGTYVNAAELITSANPVLYAKLGNGTGNGEPDEARSDLRTSSNASSLFISPDPNQLPLPDVQSNQPAPNSNEADLSLSILSSIKVATVGRLFSITLRVSNRGALSATGVSIKSLLPNGMQFFSGSGLSVSGNTVSGDVGQIPAGQSVSVAFIAKIVTPGVYVAKAQISKSSQPDSDSLPDNGYDNGEDDEASIDIRSIN